MLDGPLAALDAIEQATGEREVNVLGFCIGGILIASTLGYLAAKGDDRIKSATFLASLFDFKEVGEVAVFIDDEQIAHMEEHLREKGYLEGHHMADMFNMMRENDLIWSFVVNNYLLGREPPPFDLLYWNADATRLPATMLLFYLKQVYRENRLLQPGGLSLAGVPIDLSKVKTPTYLFATKEDHIAPWTVLLSRDPGVRRPEAVRARRVRPHRRRDQPARRQQIRLLEQPAPAQGRPTSGSRAPSSRKAPGGPTGAPGSPARPARRSPPASPATAGSSPSRTPPAPTSRSARASDPGSA